MFNFDCFLSPILFNILYALLYLMMKRFDRIFNCRKRNRIINVVASSRIVQTFLIRCILLLYCIIFHSYVIMRYVALRCVVAL